MEPGMKISVRLGPKLLIAGLWVKSLRLEVQTLRNVIKEERESEVRGLTLGCGDLAEVPTTGRR